MLGVVAVQNGIGELPVGHGYVAEQDVANVAPVRGVGGFLAGRHAQYAVPGALHILPGALLVGGGTVGAVLRPEHGQVDQLVGSVLHADVVVGNILDGSLIAVMDA